MSAPSLRDKFIQEQWVRYPSMPKSAKVFGRITQIDSQNFQVDDHPVSLPGTVDLHPCLKTFSISSQELSQILRVGDQVAIDGNRVWLLTLALGPSFLLASSQAELAAWRNYLDQVRNFFKHKDFLEVSTPTLVECPGTEPFLDLFSTNFVSGKIQKLFYLPTSPEIHLKKMLAAGHRQIFEIRPCFRNGEISENHQPEFWMLEWYRAFAGLTNIMQDTKELVEHISGQKLNFEVKTMRQLFKEKLDFELRPDSSLEDLKTLGLKLGLKVQDFDLWDDVFYFIFVEKIEQDLGILNPLFVTDYPPSQAALARLTPEGWGDRFELYWQGLEIANAFHELNDPVIQSQRFQEDLQKKKDLGKQVPQLDPEFTQALLSGLPPSGGIALGLERLFMAKNRLQTIEKTRAFPLKP